MAFHLKNAIPQIMKSADLIMEIGNSMTEDLDIFINIDIDDSEELVQVNLRDTEEELICKKIVLMKMHL